MITYKVGRKIDPLFEEERITGDDGKEGKLHHIRHRPLLTEEQSFKLSMYDTVIFIIEEDDTADRQWEITQGDNYMGRLKKKSENKGELLYELNISGKFFDLKHHTEKPGRHIDVYSSEGRTGSITKKPFTVRNLEISEEIPEEERGALLLSMLVASLAK